MIPAPIPADDRERLASLDQLSLFDTPPEQRFDRFTRIAAQLFQVSMSMVSLVGEDRVWFKSRFGTETEQSPRDISFCGHALAADGLMVVPDARLDSRFSDNPLVTREPFIRFYAACPLRGPDGSRVGVLCIADSVPRDFTLEQLEPLADLSMLVEQEVQRDHQVRRASALQQAESMLTILMEAVADGVLVAGPLGIIEAANAAAARIFAFDPEELVGRNIGELMPEPDREKHSGYFRGYAEGAPFPLAFCREGIGLRKGGARFPVEITVCATRPEKNLRFVVVLRDISKARRIEKERDHLRRYVSLPFNIFCVIGFDGFFKHVSDGLESELGLSREELALRPFLDFVYPEDREKTRMAAEQVIAGGRIISFENRYVASDGSLRWLVWDAEAYQQDELIYAVARDITRRRNAERALALSEERWQSAIRLGDGGFWEWDVRTGRVLFSEKCSRMFGYEAGEIKDRMDDWTMRIHPEDVRAVLRAVDDHLRERTGMLVCEHRILCKDGGYKRVRTRARASWDEEGKPFRMIGCFTLV